jgi:hypothetical protein
MAILLRGLVVIRVGGLAKTRLLLEGFESLKTNTCISP